MSIKLIKRPPAAMDVTCPHCNLVFRTRKTGVQNCPHCGATVKVTAENGKGER